MATEKEKEGGFLLPNTIPDLAAERARLAARTLQTIDHCEVLDEEQKQLIKDEIFVIVFQFINERDTTGPALDKLKEEFNDKNS